MKNVCSILGTIFLILGIIGSIVLAWNNGVEVTYETYLGVEEERDILLTIVWFACGIFSTAIGTVILMSLGEILEYQENISRRISTIENRLESMQLLNKDKDGDSIIHGDSWKCHKCGRVNASYTGTCACGQEKKCR